MNARRWTALLIFAATATAASYGLTRKSVATIAPPPAIQAVKAPAENLWPGFAIYLTKGEATTAELLKTPLAKVPLNPFPLMTEQDVDSYDWESQTVRLKLGIAPGSRNDYGAKPLDADAYYAYEPNGDAFIEGTTFVVVAGGERIYLGGNMKGESATGGFPSIDINALKRVSSGFAGGRARMIPALQFRIEPSQRDQTQRELDPRKDVRIYAALKKAGILANSGKAANG